MRLKETTQGSLKKEYGPYLVEKIKLKKPLKVVFNGKPVKIRYKTKIQSIKQKGGNGLSNLSYDEIKHILEQSNSLKNLMSFRGSSREYRHIVNTQILTNKNILREIFKKTLVIIY